MDGQVVPIKKDEDELLVTMTDRTVHRYLRTRPVAPTSRQDAAVVFEWSGRARP
jgi:hypothetical protein